MNAPSAPDRQQQIKQFGNLLQEALVTVTVDEVARCLGTSATHIEHILEGKSIPGASELSMIISVPRLSHARRATIEDAHRTLLQSLQPKRDPRCSGPGRASTITSPRRHLPDHGPAESPPPLVDDAVGYDSKPDPLTINNEEEFIAALRAFRQWAGGYSSRQLWRWCGMTVSHSTINALLADNPRKRPQLRLAYVQAIIRACGGDEEELRRWTTAWRRINTPQSTTDRQGEVIRLPRAAS